MQEIERTTARDAIPSKVEDRHLIGTTQQVVECPRGTEDEIKCAVDPMDDIIIGELRGRSTTIGHGGRVIVSLPPAPRGKQVATEEEDRLDLRNRYRIDQAGENTNLIVGRHTLSRRSCPCRLRQYRVLEGNPLITSTSSLH